MSDSGSFNSAKDEEFDALASDAAHSSEEEPLVKITKTPGKRGRPAKAAGAKPSKKPKVKPRRKAGRPKGKKTEKRVTMELVPTTKKEESEEEEYEVESIVGHREYNGRLVYKIRWKGYEAVHDTWEDYCSLSCPDLLEMYNIKHRVVVSKSASQKRAPRGRPHKKDKKQKKKRRSSISESSEEETDFEGEGDGEVDGEEEYEVDRIVEVRHKKDGTREFLVHWKRWSSSYDTWEPEKNLSCADLIEKFMQKVDHAKNSSAKELRTHRKHTERFTLNTQESGRRLSRRGGGKQRVKYYDAEESE